MAAGANNNNNNNKGENDEDGAASVQKGASSTNGFLVNASNNGGSSSGGGGGGGGGGENSVQSGLRHNPGISVEWSPDEQSLLEDLLTKHASESVIVRYAKIAMQLKDKTVRDVALRCRWMTKKENGKRRKEDHSSRKNKDRKERAVDSSAKSSSNLTPRPNGPSYVPPMIPMDNDDGIPFKAIGGATGELLEQNSQMLSQISTNFASFQIHENINLFSKARDNILAVLNDLNDMPEIMKQMPPLPMKLNEELANTILPPPSQQRNS